MTAYSRTVKKGRFETGANQSYVPPTTAQMQIARLERLFSGVKTQLRTVQEERDLLNAERVKERRKRRKVEKVAPPRDEHDDENDRETQAQADDGLAESQ